MLKKRTIYENKSYKDTKKHVVGECKKHVAYKGREKVHVRKTRHRIRITSRMSSLFAQKKNYKDAKKHVFGKSLKFL